MRPLTIFNLIIAVLSIIMVLAGSVMISRTDNAYWILYGGLALATIFSLFSIIDVFKARNMNAGRRTLWLIMVICVPVMGGLIFYLIHYGKEGGKEGSNVISTPDYEDNA
jgi:uncharacterized membrane protein YhaH (DUF805 family)